nr:MAG TPA: hypothetical protein [Caudoviricetes sp.]
MGRVSHITAKARIVWNVRVAKTYSGVLFYLHRVMSV